MNDIVRNQIKKAYQCLYNPEWTVEEYLNVFEMFFEYYRRYRGIKHPHMRSETVISVMEQLEYCYDDEYCNLHERYMTPEDYELIIPRYFETRFKNCNYSICHFVSGNIRMLRLYEEGV